MTNVTEKMTTKNAKTILFASLIAAMIIPFSGMNFVQAEQTNAEQIREFEQKALQDGDIPTSELLDRVGDRWLSKYDDAKHFEIEQRAVKSYVDREHQQNGWNQDNVENIIKIQNFETITESVGSGHEIVLLVAQLEKLHGQYDPSEPVRKYHQWVTEQYDIPTTVQQINDRL